MADSADLELEGEADELESSGMSELVAVFGGNAQKKFAKPQQSKVNPAASKSRTEQSVKPQKVAVSNSSQSPATSAKKPPPKKQPDHTKKPGNTGSSDVGDIADLIGNLDSDSKKAAEVLPKVHTQADNSKTQAGASKTVSSSAAATRKRKSSVSDNTDSVQAKKVNDVKNEYPEPMDNTDDKSVPKDEKIAVKDDKTVAKGEKIAVKDDKTVAKDENIAVKDVKTVAKDEKIAVKDDKTVAKAEKIAVKDDKTVSKAEKDVIEVKDEKTVEKLLLCSEEDSRPIDNELVEEMMDSVKKELLPSGDKYIVKFSPVEIADLADESVQKLVTSQPNLVFFFKRQGKFKKKKGYAEVYLTQAQDTAMCIEKLLQLKLLEGRIEVTVTVSKLKKDDEILSLAILLDKNRKLVTLKSAEDVSKVPTDTTKEHLQIEKVPASAETRFLRILFPFAADVTFAKEQNKMESGFKGPVNVSYINAGLLEAVLDCCSEYTYNGHSLSIQYTKKKQEPKAKPEPEAKREASADTERRSSIHDKSVDNGSKADKDSASSAAIKPQNTTSVSAPEDEGVDEDISNMTRDVCSGMMDSLNKLRQLGTDNPNVMKILQMQNELLKLQKSLAQSTEQAAAVVEEDPWTVTAADSVDSVPKKQDEGEKGPDKKLAKEQKKKPEKESRADKQRKEMEDLQRMIEEAEEAKRQREERAKRQVEIEMQKLKELEDKRKSNWARRMIEDAKQSGTSVTGDNAASKEESQRLLKIVENKRKDAEEAKKIEETKGSFEAGVQDIFKSKQDDQQAASEVGGEEDSTQDTEMDEVTWSPNRDLHEGAPVYSEEAFSQACSGHAGGVIPWEHHIRITYYADRRCPVEACPATKYFKTADSFMSHWQVFHTPQVTVKFCQKCNAYFTNASELETHLQNRHSITNSQTVKKMSQEAREKVVANPSYRDPGRYLPPLV